MFKYRSATFISVSPYCDTCKTKAKEKRKVDKINAGEDISPKKRILEHIHKRVEALVLNYNIGKTDIMNFYQEWLAMLLFKYLDL